MAIQLHSANTKMGQEMAFSLLDNGSGATADGGFERMDEDELGIVVHQNSSAIDDSVNMESEVDFVPLRDEELAIVVHQNPGASDNSHDLESEVDFVPLRIVMPESTKSEGKKRPGIRYKPTARKTITYKKKSLCLAHSKSAKNDKDDTSMPMRKSSGPAGSRSAKKRMERKMARKPALVDDILGSALTSDAEAKMKLPEEYASITKRMLKSHVVKGFWLGLPGDFCRKHLPKEDDTITLEDEDGKSYNAKYLCKREVLSGGWGDFAREHSISVGDDVVFRFVTTKKCKVSILRNGVPGLDTSKENNMQNEAAGSDHGVKSKDHLEVTGGDNNSTSSDDGNNLASIEEVGGVEHDMRSPDPDLGGMENFHIVLHGSVIDLPDNLCRRYYKLCCVQKAVLHRNLLKTGHMLAKGVITETSNIAERVTGPLLFVSSSFSHEDLTTWRKTLESLELLGMEVAFLRRRVDDLLAILAARSSTVQFYSRRSRR